MSKHTVQSAFREKLIEHLFVGELLKISWRKEDWLEVARSEVDDFGYDLIVERDGLIRHIQLKASHVGSSTARQKVNTKLEEKPSGCVVWIYFDENTLELGPFYFLGNPPGEPLPSLTEFKLAKNTRADSSGHKAQRPNIRVVPKDKFEEIISLEEVYKKLFSVKTK